MRKVNAFIPFALAAGMALTGATATLAQPDSSDVFREQDRRAFSAFSCSKDGALIQGIFYVTPSFSDMKRLGTAITGETIVSEIGKAATDITSAVTAAELDNEASADRVNEIFGKNVATLQDAVEQKSGGISLRVDEMLFQQIDPATQPGLPACSGGGAPSQRYSLPTV